MNKFTRFAYGWVLVYVVNLGLTYILNNFLGVAYETSYGLTLLVMMVWNFFMSLKLIFRTIYSHGVLMRYSIALIALSMVNYSTTLYLTSIAWESYLYAVIFIVTTLVFLIKFFVYNRYVFTSPLEK